MKDTTNQFKHDIQSIFETGMHIMSGKYHNASLSHMDVVLLSKKSYKALKESIIPSFEKGLKDRSIYKKWNVKEKNILNQEILEKSVEEVNNGAFDCIIFEKEGLVILKKNYYAVLNDVYEYDLNN